MDADTTAGRTGHQDQLAAFEALDSGVLIGTQMIAKGLDYPEVTLVGIIAADSALNIPEYSASERTYQLLEQVAGRAGRGENGGQVVIQTYQPDHPAVRAATDHDRSLVLDQELAMRKELGYPPFVSMANVVISGADQEKARQISALVAEALGALPKDSAIILGPVPCALSKLKNRYRYHIMLKGPRHEALGPAVMEILKEMSIPTDVRVTVDIDPQSLA